MRGGSAKSSETSAGGVIDKGGLKGFVNIDPCFGGIDRATILQLSNSVYSDAEYVCLEREAIGRDTPTLTISRKRLRFNRKCHERFGGRHNPYRKRCPPCDRHAIPYMP